MRSLTLESTAVKLHTSRKYDETYRRMQAEFDICMEPGYIGDGAKWFSGVPMDILDEVLATFKFIREGATLELIVTGGEVYAPISAYAAVMMELFSVESQDYFPMEFTMTEVHETLVSTTTTKMRFSVGKRGFHIRSISK